MGGLIESVIAQRMSLLPPPPAVPGAVQAAPSPSGRHLPSAAHGMGFLPKISALGAMLEATRGLPDLLKARREARWRAGPEGRSRTA